MGGYDDTKDKTVFRSTGLRINGTRIPWPVVLFVFAVVGNGAVMQYQVTRMQSEIAALEGAPTHNRAVAILETKMENVERKIDAHVRWGHRGE